MRRIQGVLLLVAVAFVAGGWAGVPGAAQGSTGSKARAGRRAPGARAAKGPITAVMLSDIHFDPFAQRASIAQLISAPEERWDAILAGRGGSEAATPGGSQGCSEDETDTSYGMLQASLRAMRENSAGAKFVVVAGDLLAHNFECKYKAAAPGASSEDYRAFVEKTMRYVASELRGTFKGVPVYITLGNNDTDCGDYQIDAGSPFLGAIAGSVVDPSIAPADRRRALATFREGGYYRVPTLPGMNKVGLLVLDDDFMSRKYATCSGAKDEAPAKAQIAWLRTELEGARKAGQKVWVLAHVPPGVDLYSTMSKQVNVCKGGSPTVFLRNDDLADELVRDGDVVALGVFSHTHNDEWRLLQAEGNAAGSNRVPLKLVGSISPVHGNKPSFAVAQVDPHSGTMLDYEVYVGPSATDADGKWAQTYRFSEAYGKRGFSAPVLADLLGQFGSDAKGTTEASRAYIGNYIVGDTGAVIQPLWPQYICSVLHYTAAGVMECMCPAAP